MPTIHRQHGLRFAVFSDDHEPAHVHVIGAGEMKIQLGDAGRAPFAVYAVGMKARERRCAMAVVLQLQAEFIARWNEIHGDKS
jgi:uncharacterized protein DUF4160